MQKGIFSQSYNTKSATVNNAIIQLGDIDDTGKGRKFKSRFIKDGLVKIEGHGIVLLKKETLDKSLKSMIGSPVIIEHQDVTDKNADKIRCGVISDAYFNEPDGWYYAEGIIWDDKAISLINDGWSVSCSYDFLAFNDEGGEENNIKYDKEFTELNFTHLAIVNNPRYERANIVFNSKVDNDKWITIHPNGEDAKGRPLLLKDGETPREALARAYGVDEAKGQQKLFPTKEFKKTREDFQREEQEQKDIFAQHQKKLETKYRNMEFAGTENPDELQDLSGEDIDFEKWEGEKEGFEKETKSTKKDEDKHQKVRDLEDKAYKEFKKTYDNYIQGDVKISDFGKAKEQFNKKYKDAFDKLESDRFISFEDFAKRENKQSDTKEGGDKAKKEYPSRHAEILYKDLPELREKLHKAKYERAKNKEKGADVSLYDKRIKEYEDKEQQLKDEMAELRDNRRSQKERYTSLIEEQKQSDTKDKQPDSKGDLDIKKTTVKMKSGKTKEIEYVDSVPEGYKKLEGAMTAPLGYTWYHNGKSIIDKERKTILVKDKANNSKEQDMALLDELKKLIFKVENEKENKMDSKSKILSILNEKEVDKETIEEIKNEIEKMEEEKEEVKNKKKVKNEEEEVEEKEEEKEVDNEEEEDEEKVKELKKEEKKDVENKCKNSKETSTFDKINAIYNSVRALKPQTKYTSRQEKLDNAVEYFKN